MALNFHFTGGCCAVVLLLWVVSILCTDAASDLSDPRLLSKPSRTQSEQSSDVQSQRGVEFGRLSVQDMMSSLQCAPTDPTLAKHLLPWARKETVLSLAALKRYCHPDTDAVPTVTVALVNGSFYWRTCHNDDDMSCNMDPKKNPDTWGWLNMVQEVAEAVDLPDLLFMVQCGDWPEINKTMTPAVPIFHNVGGKDVWNIPWLNPYHLSAFYLGKLDEPTQPFQVEWADKIGKVYWRGAITMPEETDVAEAQNLPRVRMFEVAKDAPELFDIGVTGIDDHVEAWWGEDALKQIMKRHSVRRAPFEPLEKVGAKYKYLLNVDGTVSSCRLVWLLMSGSVLLHQESSTWELLYGYLTPWEHFVPIKADLSNMLDTVLYLEAHQEEAERIARNGARLFTEKGRAEELYCFTLSSLVSFAGSKAQVSLETLSHLGFHKAPTLASKKKFPKHRRLLERVSALRTHPEF